MTAYNYSNTSCDWCREEVIAAQGIYHKRKGSVLGFTLCVECNTLRNYKVNSSRKSRKKKRDREKFEQLLFDLNPKEGGETMVTKRTLKVRTLKASDGRITKAKLMWSSNSVAKEAGRSWYLVIDGKTYYPAKAENISSDLEARNWAGRHVRNLGFKFSD